jgi:large subunit ribosomal protein L30e
MDIDLTRKKKKVFDIDTNLKVVSKSGEIVYGKNQVLKNLRKNQYEMIIVANNCPQDVLSEIDYYNSLLDDKMFIHVYKGSSWDLGLALAKPYMISILGIYDYGDSALEKLKSKSKSKN